MFGSEKSGNKAILSTTFACETKFDNPPISGNPNIYNIPQIEPIIAKANCTKSVIITAFSPPIVE